MHYFCKINFVTIYIDSNSSAIRLLCYYSQLIYREVFFVSGARQKIIHIKQKPGLFAGSMQNGCLKKSYAKNTQASGSGQKFI